MESRVTIADVAQAAGVSKATAHRALTTRRRVSARAMERVREAAARLGYRPDPALSMLAQQRWKAGGSASRLMLGLVSASRTHGWLFERLREVAGWHGYDLKDFPAVEFASAEALTKRMRFEGVVGVIVVPFRNPDPRFEIDWNQFSAVSAGVGPMDLPIPVVRINYFESTLIALRKMRSLGYRRIGGALHRDMLDGLTPDDGRRRAALLLFQEELGPGEAAIPPLDTLHRDVKGLLDWVRRHEPDGVLGFSAEDYFFLRDAGVKMGGKLGYAALMAQPGETFLSGLCVQPDTYATAIVQKVDSLIRCNVRGPQTPVEQTVINGIWNDGATLPRRMPGKTTGRFSAAGIGSDGG